MSNARMPTIHTEIRVFRRQTSSVHASVGDLTCGRTVGGPIPITHVSRGGNAFTACIGEKNLSVNSIPHTKLKENKYFTYHVPND